MFTIDYNPVYTEYTLHATALRKPVDGLTAREAARLIATVRFPHISPDDLDGLVSAVEHEITANSHKEPYQWKLDGHKLDCLWYSQLYKSKPRSPCQE